MKQIIASALIFSFFWVACQQGEPPAKDEHLLADAPFKPIEVMYPPTYQDTAVAEDFHGTLVSDPYRWLEDPDDSATIQWVKSQNALTFGYLDQIPFRSAVRERLETLWNYERFSPPSKHGGKFYFFRNDGLQNQSVLYVRETLDAEPEVVLDPNSFSTDGTVALGETSFSDTVAGYPSSTIDDVF